MGRVELQPAMMHLHDGADEREAEAGSRLGAARIEAHETPHHVVALVVRHAGTAIGDGKVDVGLALRERDADLRLALAALDIFDGIVDEVAERLADQLAVALDLDAVGNLGDEPQAAILRDGLVELGAVMGDPADRRAPARPRRGRSSGVR
jgi:hypothetical protein